jgi:hypothetical protein
MKRPSALLLPAAALITVFAATPPPGSTWRKHLVAGEFVTEGLSVGDIDGDGHQDLVAGHLWFKGPDFKTVTRFRPGRPSPVKAYQEDSFLSWVDDLNGDGRNDILMASHPGKSLTLYLNPGPAGGDWPAHRVMEHAATECPTWTDLDLDGKREFVCMQRGCFGYAEVDWSDVTKPWTFRAISGERTKTPYIHGLGTGDVNGDGKPDIIEKDGWFEQPATPDGEWKWHEFQFAGRGGAQMLVFDADHDGDNDIITSLDGHGYGLFWYENRRDGENITFTAHEILPDDGAKSSSAGLQFSQLHALDAADFDGDGRMDFVTGKRYYAHNGRDPGAEDPALCCVFFNRKSKDGITWESLVVDNDSGVGCQVAATDLNKDGKPDIAVGSKKGVITLVR